MGATYYQPIRKPTFVHWNVTCTFVFQPQDNYKQISHKSALFSSIYSYAKQLAPGLTILDPKHQPHVSNYITRSAANQEAYIC
jgi:hypothetical protein